VPGPWTDVDFSTLEHVNGSYVSETQKQRHDDRGWRLRMKDRWLWIYLILEYQSESDPWMALRMLVYVGLPAQDLIKNKEDLSEGKLPPFSRWCSTTVARFGAPLPTSLNSSLPPRANSIPTFPISPIT
jgi:hypothetical protein